VVTNFSRIPVQTYNFGQNTVNKRQLKNKNEQYCAVGSFSFKAAETFCQFFVCEFQYFLPVKPKSKKLSELKI
jgi:hypothetical protein